MHLTHITRGSKHVQIFCPNVCKWSKNVSGIVHTLQSCSVTMSFHAGLGGEERPFQIWFQQVTEHISGATSAVFIIALFVQGCFTVMLLLLPVFYSVRWIRLRIRGRPKIIMQVTWYSGDLNASLTKSWSSILMTAPQWLWWRFSACVTVRRHLEAITIHLLHIL